MSSIESASQSPDSNDTRGYDADELGEYRSLSTLAVVALGLGIGSALTFASPLMLVVPLAAVGAALLALRAIAASGGGLTGARLARLGLALAILFTVAAFARVKVRNMLLQAQVDRVGRQWLTLAAQSRSEEMLELMTRAAVDKVSPTESGNQPLSFFGGMFATAMMRQDPLVVSLSERLEDDTLRLRLTEAEVFAGAKPPQAAIRYAAGIAEEAVECLLVFKRFQASDQATVWLVDSWKLE